MRLWPCVYLAFLLTDAAQAQVAEMKDGKVYKGDIVYCHYAETGKRISTMTLGSTDISDQLSFPEANGDEFRDYGFGREYQYFITARAKVLASAREAFLVYFYCIRFEGLDLELNIRYHPLLIRMLAQDLVKYDVIQDGFINEKNARKLSDKWETKTNLIKGSLLQQGIVSNYNSPTGRAAQKPASINIRIEGDKIYKDDSLFGYYTLDKHLGGGSLFGSGKGSNLYKIEDPAGTLLGWVSVPLLRSTFFLLPAGEKESLAVVTTDRDEQKIIASAVKVLIVHNTAKRAIR